jgi:hypothetical protein
MGVHIKGLQEMVAQSHERLEKLQMQGMKHRTVGATSMNDTSSRSHSIFTITVHQKDTNEATGKSTSLFAKINLGTFASPNPFCLRWLDVFSYLLLFYSCTIIGS